MRDISPDVPITVDAECLHFAIVTGSGDKPICRKHADIKKLSIGKVNRDSVFGKASKGDYEIVVFYKGLGKLIILNVGPDDIDPLINAVRVLSPSLKKIKDPR